MTAPSSAAAAPETESQANPAVARCANAWARTYNLASIEPGDDSFEPDHDDHDLFACDQAAIAFRNALPPLSGRQNIQDFIACVAYAMLKRILDWVEAKELLNAARIALSADRAKSRQPKP